MTNDYIMDTIDISEQSKNEISYENYIIIVLNVLHL